MKLTRSLICFVLLFPNFALAENCTALLRPESAIKSLGIYSSDFPRETADSMGTAYMYSVYLWRSGDCFFGYFFATESREGGAPRGLIDDFQYDRNSGKASFRSKLTEGYAYQGPGKPGRPGKSLFEFSGKFDTKRFSGMVRRKNFMDESAPDRSSQQAVLRFEKGSAESLSFDKDDNTYATWLENSTIMLSVNGPKW